MKPVSFIFDLFAFLFPTALMGSSVVGVNVNDDDNDDDDDDDDDVEVDI